MAKGLFYHFAEPSKNRNLQVKYEIDKILNSDLPITSEVLFNKFYRFGICSKASKLKLLLKKAFTLKIKMAIRFCIILSRKIFVISPCFY
ncbi:MAG: hypothetical protein LN567_07230 [Rickettsia endosymbiont of Graphium doson]|nr:hypothetical protein [Rickettsia endosymbiont of Graphium doson]